MSEWREVKLGDCVVVNKQTLPRDYQGKIRYIDISSVSEGVLNGYNEIEYQDAPSRARRLVEDGDIIYSTVRPNLKGYYKFNDRVMENTVVSTGFIVLSKTKYASIDYIYYYITEDSFVNYLTNVAKGAAYPAVGIDDFKKAKIRVPNLETQRKIANVLSTYDKLIENNNRRIQILEQTAEELYKEWFVRMRFPGYEKTKFGKGIPEGWEVKKVKGLVKRYRYGSLYKENDVMKEGNVIVIDQSEKDFLGFHNNEPDHFAGIDNPIILFGDHSCKMLIMTSPFSLSENVIPFNAENNLNTLFLFYAVRGLVHTTEYKRHWSDLTNKRILVPDYSLQQKFEAKVKNIIILINEYKKSNLNLIKQRDLLLPRLMNGTITVK